MTYFKEGLKSIDTKLALLPILHSCTAYTFRSILEDMELKKSLCDVFGKEYLYGYYGIPSYRKNINGATGLDAYFPICFVFDYSSIPNLTRLHPFDTGAFKKLEEVKRHFHADMELEHFELEPNIKEAQKLVEKFYGSNDTYILKKPVLESKDLATSRFEEISYLALIKDESLDKFDNRLATIELIFEENIPLNSSSLIHIILPNTLYTDPDIKNLINKTFGISNPGLYFTVKSSPNEYFGVVYNKYIEYLISKGLFQ